MSGPKCFEFNFDEEAQARLEGQRQQRERADLRQGISQIADALIENLGTLTTTDSGLKRKVRSATELAEQCRNESASTTAIPKLQKLLADLKRETSGFGELQQLHANNLFAILSAGLTNVTLNRWECRLPGLSTLRTTVAGFRTGENADISLQARYEAVHDELKKMQRAADELQAMSDRRAEILRALIGHFSSGDRSTTGREIVFHKDMDALKKDPGAPLELRFKHSSGAMERMVFDLELNDVVRTPDDSTDDHALVNELINILLQSGIIADWTPLRHTEPKPDGPDRDRTAKNFSDSKSRGT